MAAVAYDEYYNDTLRMMADFGVANNFQNCPAAGCKHDHFTAAARELPLSRLYLTMYTVTGNYVRVRLSASYMVVIRPHKIHCHHLTSNTDTAPMIGFARQQLGARQMFRAG